MTPVCRPGPLAGRRGPGRLSAEGRGRACSVRAPSPGQAPPRGPDSPQGGPAAPRDCWGGVWPCESGPQVKGASVRDGEAVPGSGVSPGEAGGARSEAAWEPLEGLALGADAGQGRGAGELEGAAGASALGVKGGPAPVEARDPGEPRACPQLRHAVPGQGPEDDPGGEVPGCRGGGAPQGQCRPRPARPTCTGTATLCGEPQEESVPQPATRPRLTGRAAARRGQRAGADGSQPRFAPRRRSRVLWDLEQVAGLLWVVSSSVK